MSREDHITARLLNAVHRNYPGLDERDVLLFLSAVGPTWLLNIRNLGWGAVEAALRYVNERGEWNEDLAIALRRHAKGDQFKLKDGRWV